MELLWGALGFLAMISLYAFGEIIGSLVLEVLVRGVGAFILTMVFRQDDVEGDRWPSFVVGFLFWVLVAAGVTWAASTYGLFGE